MNWVKENWGQLTMACAGLVSLHLFVMWVMVNAAVKTALNEQDLAKDTNIMTLNTSVADNKRTGEENAEDIDHNRSDVRAAFTRLFKGSDDEDDK